MCGVGWDYYMAIIRIIRPFLKKYTRCTCILPWKMLPVYLIKVELNKLIIVCLQITKKLPRKYVLTVWQLKNHYGLYSSFNEDQHFSG